MCIAHRHSLQQNRCPEHSSRSVLERVLSKEGGRDVKCDKDVAWYRTLARAAG